MLQYRNHISPKTHGSFSCRMIFQSQDLKYLFFPVAGSVIHLLSYWAELENMCLYAFNKLCMLIFILVYTYIFWKPVSTNNCTGFIPVSSFSVLIMLFSGSGDSGSSIDSLVTSLGQLPSCLAASPRPRGSLLPLHSFWHSEPGCLCRDDLSSCLTHPYPQCQQAQSWNTFHLAWLCHIAASPHCNLDALPSLLKCSLSQAISSCSHGLPCHHIHLVNKHIIFNYI